MKKIISIRLHPVWLIVSYCCVLLTSDKMGGPWFLYLSLSIIYFLFSPETTYVCMMGVVGIILACNNFFKKVLLKGIFRLVGLILMYVSLLVTIYLGIPNGTLSTFHEPITLISFCQFVVVSIVFLISTYNTYLKKKHRL
jgi:hypothetical protein